KIANTFTGFRFSINWDFAETNVIGYSTGSYSGQLEWIALLIEHAMQASNARPTALCQSAIKVIQRDANDRLALFDIILTYPPYYEAISYSDLMDFFHIWLRRTLHGLSPELDAVFSTSLGPKWDHQANDGELVDDPSRHGWDRAKEVYEDGMYRTFVA